MVCGSRLDENAPHTHLPHAERTPRPRASTQHKADGTPSPPGHGQPGSCAIGGWPSLRPLRPVLQGHSSSMRTVYTRLERIGTRTRVRGHSLGRTGLSSETIPSGRCRETLVQGQGPYRPASPRPRTSQCPGTVIAAPTPLLSQFVPSCLEHPPGQATGRSPGFLWLHPTLGCMVTLPIPAISGPQGLH